MPERPPVGVCCYGGPLATGSEVYMAAPYSLHDFISGMEDLLQQGVDERTLLETGAALLSRLVNNPLAVPPEYRVPAINGRLPNHATYLLHLSPTGMSVTAVVWGPGDQAPPHDHRAWGLIGVAANQIQETRYRRLDNEADPDMAQLELSSVQIHKRGEVSILWPGVDEIHGMNNPTTENTVEIHVYGKDMKGLQRTRFDPDTGAVRPFITDRYDND